MQRRRTNFLEEQENQHTPHREPPRSRRRLFYIVAIVSVMFISGCIARSVINTSLPSDPSLYDPITLEPKKPEGLLKRIKQLVFSKDTELPGKKEGRINILLLGMGGLGHDGPFLTDTIIIASIEPSTNKISMISIPRDLGVNIPEYGWYKINHANAFGETKQSGWGGALATEVIEKTFDIDIHYYVRIDFKAFGEIIDEVDGVTVEVARSFTDTEYPAPNYEYQTVSFQKGTHTLFGGKALQYARSRHGNNGEGSDFARAKRQQNILLALKEKILSFETLANPIRIYNIINTLDSHITTNMSFGEIMSLVKLGKELDLKNIHTVVLDTSEGGYLKNGYSPNGAFILEPATGNFEDIQSLIANIFDDTYEAPIQKIVVPEQETPILPITLVEVQNGTWQAGLAARTKKRLENDGIGVATVGNTDIRPQLESAIYVLKAHGQTAAQAIKSKLNIPIKQVDDTFSHATTTEVLVILGEDYSIN